MSDRPPGAGEQPNESAAGQTPGDAAEFRADGAFSARRRRRVVLGAVAFVAISFGLYQAAPYLLPVYIVEGPLVQLAGEQSASLVWFTSRPAGHLALTVGADGRSFPVRVEGRRCVAAIAGLAPGASVPYEIHAKKRTLATKALRTNKPRAAPFRFVVFGDSGKGTQAQRLLGLRMAADDPDLALHTGDLIYGSGERRRYKSRFFDPYAEMLARVAFWPSLGNHDVAERTEGHPYLQVFELPLNGPAGLAPEHNYWFDYGAARFVVIDSNLDEDTLAEHVAPWIVEALAPADIEWRFAVFHHPPYTGGAHDPAARVQSALVPAFEQAGVDIVFSGHDHMYERTAPMRGGSPAPDGRGVVYVVTGAGGARLYEPLPPEQRPEYLAALDASIHSYTRVSIAQQRLLLEQISVEGRTLDSWTLDKSAGP